MRNMYQTFSQSIKTLLLLRHGRALQTAFYNLMKVISVMLDCNKVLDTYPHTLSPAQRKLALSLVDPENRALRYCFGRNALSLALSDLIRADAYIDDFAPPGSTWYGKPVLTLEQVGRDDIIVNCVINAKPRTAFARLQAAGFSQLVSYASLCKAMPETIPLPDFVRETRADVTLHAQQWRAVFDRLADDESRQVFNDVLHYRLTGDHTVLANYSFRPQEQYFEDFMDFEREVFVDAGGFDGDTTEQFCRRYPDYRQVYLFEPSPQNIALARQRLAGFEHIEFIEKGVSDSEGTLYFNANEGSSSAVTLEGDSAIHVTTIDACIASEVSFIKMDLEGWEINALKGAAQHIARERPKLAIAVYHRPSDMWGIFNLVDSYAPGYRIYLRHYTESWTETVMFFLPDSTGQAVG